MAGAVALTVALGVGIYLAESPGATASRTTSQGAATPPSAKAGIAGIATSSPRRGRSKPPLVGDACLVGTWLNGPGATSTNIAGTMVTLYSGGGDEDHIYAAGTDRNSWGAGAKPYYGTYKGATLEEMLHGTHTTTIRATPGSHKISVTDDGWSSGSTNVYVYLGQKIAGSFGSKGKVASEKYMCTATTLEWISNGQVNDTETRVSDTP